MKSLKDEGILDKIDIVSPQAATEGRSFKSSHKKPC